MAIAALITWIIAALGGFVMLGRWIRAGGPRSSETKFRAPVIFGHFGLAAVGLVLWIIYLVADLDALAWISLVILVLVAILGATMFLGWVGDRGGERPESSVPLPVAAGHGLFAVATVVIVLIAAITA